MANSYVQYVADGLTQDFTVTFPYLSADHVAVTVNGASAAFTWVDATTVRVTSMPTSGQTVRISRTTPRNARVVDFSDGNMLKESDLDSQIDQLFFISQEALDNTAHEALLDSIDLCNLVLSKEDLYTKAELWAEEDEDVEVETGKYSAKHWAAKAALYALGTHAATHQSGGADAIKLDDLAAPDDNTDLAVSTSTHGLTPKAPNETTKFLRGDATWAKVIGEDLYLGDSTLNNVSASKHGFVPKAPNDITQYLRGDGAWDYSTVRQIKVAQSATRITYTTAIPVDDTVPQNTEGEQAMYVYITPKRADSLLIVEVSLWGGCGNRAGTVALFKGAEASARASATKYVRNGEMEHFHLTYVMTAGTTSQILFTVRVGAQDTTGFAVNWNWNSLIGGGTTISSIKVTEVRAD